MQHLTHTFFKENFSLNNFTIIANCINYCNFACEYCCEFCNTRAKNTYKVLDLNNLITYISRYSSNKDLELLVSLYGGEPTLHPQLLEFCKQCKNIKNPHLFNITPEIFTNFSADIKTYFDLLNLGCDLIITYHHKFISQEEFKNKLFSLPKNQVSQIIINIMLEPTTFSEDIQFFKQIYDYMYCTNHVSKSHVFLKSIRSNVDFSIIYNIEQCDKMNNIIDNLDCNNYTKYNFFGTSVYDKDFEKYNLSFKHQLCTAGLTSQYLDINGNIYYCSSKKDLETLSGNKQCIGNIKSMPFSPRTSCILCTSNGCTDYDSKKIKIFNNEK